MSLIAIYKLIPTLNFYSINSCILFLHMVFFLSQSSAFKTTMEPVPTTKVKEALAAPTTGKKSTIQSKPRVVPARVSQRRQTTINVKYNERSSSDSSGSDDANTGPQKKPSQSRPTTATKRKKAKKVDEYQLSDGCDSDFEPEPPPKQKRHYSRPKTTLTPPLASISIAANDDNAMEIDDGNDDNRTATTTTSTTTQGGLLSHRDIVRLIERQRNHITKKASLQHCIITMNEKS